MEKFTTVIKTSKQYEDPVMNSKMDSGPVLFLHAYDDILNYCKEIYNKYYNDAREESIRYNDSEEDFKKLYNKMMTKGKLLNSTGIEFFDLFFR